ncbi:MAG: right-handed parallel beta-helix repeat-containing protein [Terriglobales bacterium]
MVVLFLSPAANAADVTVECNKKKTTNFTSINTALASLSKQGPHTVHVSGNCKEAVVIDGFYSLTLVGDSPGASISDPTPSVPDDNDVIDISYSRNVFVKDLTINGGSSGIACFRFSNCDLQNLVVQGASDTGVLYVRSGDGVADNVTIQNTGFAGLQVLNGSNVAFGGGFLAEGTTSTIQNNGNAENGALGVNVLHNSTLFLANTTVQNHSNGDGVNVAFGSVLRVLGATITGSGGNGVSVETSQVLLQGANEITGNVGNGVRLSHLSYLRAGGDKVISGNGAPDVNCSVSTAKTRGTGGSGTETLGGGTTNCAEPAP